MTWTLILERCDFDEDLLPDLKRSLTAVLGNYGSEPPVFTTVSTVQYEAHLGLNRVPVLLQARADQHNGAAAQPRLRPQNQRKGYAA